MTMHRPAADLVLQCEGRRKKMKKKGTKEKKKNRTLVANGEKTILKMTSDTCKASKESM